MGWAASVIFPRGLGWRSRRQPLRTRNLALLIITRKVRWCTSLGGRKELMCSILIRHSRWWVDPSRGWHTRSCPSGMLVVRRIRSYSGRHSYAMLLVIPKHENNYRNPHNSNKDRADNKTNHRRFNHFLFCFFLGLLLDVQWLNTSQTWISLLRPILTTTAVTLFRTEMTEYVFLVMQFQE